MTREMNKEMLENYYFNATESYKRCIEVEENSFLSDELGISVHDLDVKMDSVRFKYLGLHSDAYLIEVRVDLFSNDFYLGHYISVLDEDGLEIDNYLVFK
ncbi:hypothetical protein [Niabella hibiscisoli]|uniref:hypothetical protein n=1 Tax=Niabella hibiscisoli TaxID=1825928 RepID=UPI001F0F7DC0|nr:hypothetical protein [Niabella hibiscisoli]MCH5720504.1 hypothetical protein [Niabella hibiscisoli]